MKFVVRGLVVTLSTLLIVGCAGPTRYGVGPYQALDARDAEVAYVQKNLILVGQDPNLDRPLRAITAPMPDFPVEMRTADHEGRVIIRFKIKADGSVSDVSAVSSPHRDVARLALLAVKQWRFEPPTRQGMPFEVLFEIPFTFSVKR